jgi:cell division protein FtsL
MQQMESHTRNDDVIKTFIEKIMAAHHQFEQAINEQELQTWNATLNRLVTELKRDERILEKEQPLIVWKLLEHICLAHSTQDKELLLFYEQDTIDKELASVIKGRWQRNEKKNIKLIVLNKQLAELLGQAEPDNMGHTLQIKKLSLLNHWNAKRDQQKQVITNLLVGLIKKISTVEKVILRGCSTAANLKNVKCKPKTCTIVSGKKILKNEPVKPHEFLFQQNLENGECKTRIKFIDDVVDERMIIKEIPNIPALPSAGANKLSPDIEKALVSEARKHNLPPLSLPSFLPLLSSIRDAWWNNQLLSTEEKKMAQALMPNMKTYEVENFYPRSLASVLDIGLRKQHLAVKSIKAYGSFYQMFGPGTGVTSGNSRNDDLRSVVKIFRP